MAEIRRHRAHAAACGVVLAPPLEAGAAYDVETEPVALAIGDAPLPTTDGVARGDFLRRLARAFALAPDAPFFKVIGRHGFEGAWFEIGRGPMRVVGEGRALHVALNDAPWFFDSHQGEIEIIIKPAEAVSEAAR